MIENNIKQFRFMRQKSKDRLNTNAKTKERLGLAEREIASSSYEMRRAAQNTREALDDVYNPAQKINTWADELDSLRAQRASLEQSTTGAMAEEQRPRRRYPNNFTGEVTVPEEIQADPEFNLAVQNLADKYGITTNEIFAVIKGESDFNPRARNPSGATGLFQFMPATAEELGTSVEEIMAMTPVQQVELYDRYLSKWNYDGSNRLGIMQAAPAYASSGTADPTDIIYDVGSAAWEQNPGWRELNNGPVTVQSINAYYSRRQN